MNTIIEIMTGARAILSDPNRWLQRALYQRVDGLSDRDGILSRDTAQPSDRVCTVGSIYAVLDAKTVTRLRNGMTWDEREPMYAIHRFLKQAVLDLYGTKIDNIISWQDARSRTHEQVVAVFDRAIELAQDEEDWKIPVMTTEQVEQISEYVADSFATSEVVAVDPALLLV